MPNTRSHCSNTPSETNEILTQSDLETLNQKLNEKERMLKEHAKMLQIKQDELKNLQREIEQSRNANSDNNQYESIIKNLNEQISALVSLPEQMEQLNQRINDIQFSNQLHNQQTNYNSDYYSAQNFPRRSSPADTASPIRLMDVVDSIPKYDGHKIPVFYFSKMCERALELIPGYHEYHLVQLIINKLQGHAYGAIEGTEYHTVFELTRKLKRIFGPNKSVDQYRGELANIYMKPNENIFDYIEKVKELRAAIIDGETDAGGYIDEITKDNIERSVTTSFINGLPSDLLIRVKLERSYTFDGALESAIQLSKTLEAENARKRTVPLYKSNISPRADFLNKSGLPQATNLPQSNETQHPRNNTTPFIKPLIPGIPGSNYPVGKTCRYCKNPGHLIDECRKLAYKRSTENNPSISYSNNHNNNPETHRAFR
ncbi:hypothetical protein ACFW04_012867 [Cataglyphis niger]